MSYNALVWLGVLFLFLTDVLTYSLSQLRGSSVFAMEKFTFPHRNPNISHAATAFTLAENSLITSIMNTSERDSADCLHEPRKVWPLTENRAPFVSHHHERGPAATCCVCEQLQSDISQRRCHVAVQRLQGRTTCPRWGKAVLWSEGRGGIQQSYIHTAGDNICIVM